MPIEKETVVEESTEGEPVSERQDRPERAERIDDRHPRDRVAGKEKGRDLRALVKDAIKENAPAEEKTAANKTPMQVGKNALNAKGDDRGAKAVSPADKPIPETPKSGETASVAAPQAQAAVAAPAALSKEVKAIWDTLPDAAKAEFVKREADTTKGVEQLKAKYKPYEDAFAPVKGQLQQLGKTEPEAISQLLNWQAALANPRTQAEAFRALAQAHRFDLSTLAPKAAGTVDPNQPPDPSQAFRSLVDPLSQKVSHLETELQRRDREHVQADITSYSKDKPHFDRVRSTMGVLMERGMVNGATPKEAFDDAYERACRADPEVFAMIQQEAQEKREAEAKADAEAKAKKAAEDAEALKRKQAEEVAKARRAGVGPRSGSPTGMAIAAASKGQSVRDSIKSTVKELGAAI